MGGAKEGDKIVNDSPLRVCSSLQRLIPQRVSVEALETVDMTIQQARENAGFVVFVVL